MTHAVTPSRTEAATETDPTTPVDQARVTLVLRLLTVAAFVVILNETLMLNALPPLMEIFAIDAATGQWLTTGFMLTMAVVIPMTGWLLQRLSLRSAYALAMGTFIVGTVVCATAPTFAVLLGGRVVQAAGTAVMMPLLMTTIMTLVPHGRRGRVMGNLTLAISVAPAMGPTVSGLILQLGSWRWLFGLVLPIAMQDVRGMSALQSGLMLLPGALAMGLLGPAVGRLYDRVGPRPLVVPGALVVAGALLGLALTIQHSPWWVVVVLHSTMSIGLSFLFTPSFTAGLGSLPTRLSSHGSALLGAGQQVAGAAGAALVVTVMQVTAASAAAGGPVTAAATGDGIRIALLVAATLATGLVVLSLFVRAPREDADQGRQQDDPTPDRTVR